MTVSYICGLKPHNVPMVAMEVNGPLGTVLEVSSPMDTFLTPAQARELAAALVRAAEVLEGLVA